MHECPKMSTEKRNVAVSWCVDGVKPFGQERYTNTQTHKHKHNTKVKTKTKTHHHSSRSLDLSVIRIESLPGPERSKSSNMFLLQVVTDRHLNVVHPL